MPAATGSPLTGWGSLQAKKSAMQSAEAGQDVSSGRLGGKMKRMLPSGWILSLLPAPPPQKRMPYRSAAVCGKKESLLSTGSTRERRSPKIPETAENPGRMGHPERERRHDKTDRRTAHTVLQTVHIPSVPPLLPLPPQLQPIRTDRSAAVRGSQGADSVSCKNSSLSSLGKGRDGRSAGNFLMEEAAIIFLAEKRMIS